MKCQKLDMNSCRMHRPWVYYQARLESYQKMEPSAHHLPAGLKESQKHG